MLDALADGDTGESLAALAARSGFADQAHMTRSVRREIAMSPGRVRRHFAADRTPEARVTIV